MVRLIALMLMAGPAAAGCFGPPMPKVVHYDNGLSMEVVSHTAQDLTSRMTFPDGRVQTLAQRSGLFILTTSGGGITQQFKWLSDLPDLTQMQPGQHFDLEGDMWVEQASRISFHSEIDVLRQETLRVADCDYPVIVVQRTDRAGRLNFVTTLWIAPRLLMALRSESTTDEMETYDVTGFE